MGKLANVEKKPQPQNNQWVKEEIKREITKSLETNENKNATQQNLENTAKAF